MSSDLRRRTNAGSVSPANSDPFTPKEEPKNSKKVSRKGKTDVARDENDRSEAEPGKAVSNQTSKNMLEKDLKRNQPKKLAADQQKDQKQSESDFSKYIISFLMPVIVVGTLIVSRLFAKEIVSIEQLVPYPRSFGTHTILEPIERVVWDPKKMVSAELIKGGRPKVLTNTFASNWTALKEWKVDGEYLSKFMPKTLVNVYRNKHHYFGPLFRPNKPLTRLPGVEWENPHEMISMPTNAFFAQVTGNAANTNGTYLYYTGDLSAPVLAKDLEPWRDLLPRMEQQRVNVWVSQRGVTAHLHVDSYENFFVQIQGRKRMLLFPPSSSVHAPLYPFMHPSYGQAQPYIQATPPQGMNTPMPTSSQADVSIFAKALNLARKVFAGVFVPEHHDTARRLTRGTGSALPETLGGDPVSKKTGRTRESELNKFPDLSGLVGYEAILGPGDLMYIPPNWYHHVEALDPAISVNFWSESWPQTHYDKAIRFAVQSLIHDWSFPQKRSAAAYLARLVIEGTQKDMDFGPKDKDSEKLSLAGRFFKRHILSRYQDMVNRGQIQASPLFPDKCEITDDLMLPNMKPNDYTEVARLLGAIGPNETLPLDMPTNQKLLRSLKAVADKIIVEFNQIPASERPIWLGNFFESIGYWTGDVDAAHLYGSLSCITYADTDMMHKGATYEFKQ